MKNKLLGSVVMIISAMLFIANSFYLNETPLGHTSMSFEHSFITLMIGYLIYSIKQNRE